MKKRNVITYVLMFMLCMVLTLSACGNGGPAGGGVDFNDFHGNQEQTTEAQPEETAAADMKALAESCIDKDISELYALIGEPASSEYAPSCLVEGEDGALYYDGFVVYTTREGNEADGFVETVYYVE